MHYLATQKSIDSDTNTLVAMVQNGTLLLSMENKAVAWQIMNIKYKLSFLDYKNIPPVECSVNDRTRCSGSGQIKPELS